MSSVSTGARAIKLLGNSSAKFGNRVAGLFRQRPDTMAAFAKQIPALAGKRLSVGSIKNYVTKNPVEALLVLSVIPEAADLVTGLQAEIPGLDGILHASLADDTLETLGLSREERREQRAETLSSINKEVNELPIGELMNFKDEAVLIDDVLINMPGRTSIERRASLEKLRRVLLMPEANFVMYDTLKTLSE